MNKTHLAVLGRSLVFSVLTAFISSGCATRTITTGRPAGASPPENGATIAVVPFENLSHSRNAGLVLTDLATTALYAQNHFHVVEVGSLADDKETRFRRFDISPWERQLGINTTSATVIGRALKTQWVLAGSVGEYGFVDGFGETANVGVTLRLVRVSDGEVAWAGSLSRRAAASAFNEESVHRLAHEVAIELLGRMLRETSGPKASTARAN